MARVSVMRSLRRREIFDLSADPDACHSSPPPIRQSPPIRQRLFASPSRSAQRCFATDIAAEQLASASGENPCDHAMPDRNNTNQPRSNSFRRFCTVETCQYVYYCLRCVAARQSSRHLAYMQGARIKACGSFPPQIVLALTSSKNSRRGSRAAPLCGDSEAKSSENLLL